MNLTTARLVTTRNLNEGSNTTLYPAEAVDTAIIEVLTRFCRKTRFLLTTSDVVLTHAAAAMGTFPTGFRPDMAVRAWIATEADVEIIDHESLQGYQNADDGEGVPEYLAFTSLTTGEVWPTPDAAYTLTLRWSKPFTSWTPGVAGDGVTLELPDDVLYELLPIGPAAALTRANRAEPHFTGPAWQQYLAFEREMAGSGGAGVRAVVREKDE